MRKRAATMPKVSVVVPVYNAEKYLRENVESLLDQTLQDVEYFFVDDGSTDDSLAILQEYAAKDSRMTILHNPIKGQGAAMARNFGIDHVRGKYLSILDADDSFAPEMLEKLYAQAEAVQADIVFYDAYRVDVQTGRMDAPNWYLDRERFPMQQVFSPRVFADRMFQISNASVWLKFFSRDLIVRKKLRFQPFHYVDDIVFTFTAIAEAERVVALPERFVYYRVNDAGSQTMQAFRHPEAGYCATDALYQELRRRGLLGTYQVTFLNDAARNFDNVAKKLQRMDDYQTLYDADKGRLSRWGLTSGRMKRLSWRARGVFSKMLEMTAQEYRTGKKSKKRRENMTGTLHLPKTITDQPLALWGFRTLDAMLQQQVVQAVDVRKTCMVEEDAGLWGSLCHGMPVCAPAAIHGAQTILCCNGATENVRKQVAGGTVLDIQAYIVPSAQKSVKKPDKGEHENMANKGGTSVEDAWRKRAEEKHRPHTLLRFEVQLAEHCNLNCRGCTHYAPLAKPEFLDVEEYGRDIARLADLFDHEVRWIHLMGGEPLLHPEIVKVMRMTREAFPYGQIMVVTNGVLLGKMTDAFWQTCKEYDIEISATKYPIPCDYDAYESKAREKGVKFTFYNAGQRIKTLNRYPLSVAGHQHVEDSFVRCFGSNRCLTLRHGRIYGCDLAAHAHHLIQAFQLPIHESRRDSIDIYEAQTPEEIMEHCAKPIPFCRYCDVARSTEGYPFGTSHRNRYEWLDFEGTEDDWAYLKDFAHIVICADGALGQRLASGCISHGYAARMVAGKDELTALGQTQEKTAVLLGGAGVQRQEAEHLLWENKLVQVIPVTEPPDGGHG